MKNLKTKGIFTVLFTLTIFLVMALGNVFAVNRIFNLTATYTGSTLSDGQTITLTSESDRKINITVNPTYVDSTLAIGYAWDDGGVTVAATGTKTATITIPNFQEGTTHTLYMEALIKDNAHSYVGNSNVVKVYVKIPAATTISVDLKDGNTTIKDGATIEKKIGSSLTIVGTSNKTVKQIAYAWNNEKINVVDGASATIKIPAFDSNEISLSIQAAASDNTVSKSKTFKIKILPDTLTGDLAVSYNGKTLSNASTTTVNKLDKVTVTCSPAANFSGFSGKWEYVTASGNTLAGNISSTKASETLQIPGEAGQTIKLTLTGNLKDGGKTTTKVYTFKIPAENKPLTGNVEVSKGTNTLSTGTVNEFDVGTKLTLLGTPAENFVKITYQWDLETAKDITGATGEITVPNFEAGSEHTLKITGTLKDGTIVSQKIYKIRIPKIEEPEKPEKPEPLTGNISVKMDNKTLSNSSKNIVFGDEILTLTGSPANNFATIIYKWDNGNEKEISGNVATIDMVAEKGETHTLKVYGILKDGTKILTKTYYFMIEEDEELIIEPWMREDKEADGLLVSLRNDTEEEKANKNFYQLDEEVIYYVDYKNCGKDINGEVKLVLTLPLKFDVVDAANGTVSKSDKTITWTFPNGLEEEQAGTKEVVIRYTNLSKNSYNYEIVYPVANIYQKSKKMDSSAVINYIYESDSTVIKDEHDPYMFGDKEKPTFRPDASISRAEGALVLTRIFGVKISGVKVTTKYSDIGDTYLEAQKAITAATELGIIDGYEDGTYKPNKKMTRAEFMKIIASYIEVIGEEENIDGLEVKEDNIKVYKNSSNKNHWAISYVTLLTRLNMTGVTSSKKDLRLNDEITRAEVAQLINFYSFRAPAKVSSSTKIQFSDVSRKHTLFEDIVEATRDTHTFSIMEDGKEKVK